MMIFMRRFHAPAPWLRRPEPAICAETAARQAQEVGHSLQAELCLLVAHGVLHVLGYEDYDEASSATMDALQQGVLARLRERLARHE